MNKQLFNRFVGRIAGHIRKPYTLRQIVRQIESNDYNAEMMLQHLLRWVAANVGSDASASLPIASTGFVGD